MHSGAKTVGKTFENFSNYLLNETAEIEIAKGMSQSINQNRCADAHRRCLFHTKILAQKF
jgi:hypothetical protein